MSPPRVAELIGKATYHRVDECWIARHPVLLMGEWPQQQQLKAISDVICVGLKCSQICCGLLCKVVDMASNVVDTASNVVDTASNVVDTASNAAWNAVLAANKA